jgi:RNase P/RNase MRP subunit POP5
MKKQVSRRLKPSKKEKRHYIVLAASSHDAARIREACRQWSIKLIYFDNKKGKAMISALTKEVKAIKEALADAGFECVGVSGTIKRARQKFI